MIVWPQILRRENTLRWRHSFQFSLEGELLDGVSLSLKAHPRGQRPVNSLFGIKKVRTGGRTVSTLVQVTPLPGIDSGQQSGP